MGVCQGISTRAATAIGRRLTFAGLGSASSLLNPVGRRSHFEQPFFLLLLPLCNRCQPSRSKFAFLFLVPVLHLLAKNFEEFLQRYVAAAHTHQFIFRSSCTWCSNSVIPSSSVGSDTPRYSLWPRSISRMLSMFRADRPSHISGVKPYRTRRATNNFRTSWMLMSVHHWLLLGLFWFRVGHDNWFVPESLRTEDFF